jgi:fucose 4-O-acetylase-like acetyltransferase
MADLVRPAPRVLWADLAKGVGIVLVVFGHVLRGLNDGVTMSWTPITQFIDAWIYAFHMPLFFFLSGLFLFRSTSKSWRDFACDKLRTLVYPYFVWSVVTLIIKTALGKMTHHPYDLFDVPLLLYRPIDQFWFLYVLFLLLIVSFTALKLGVRPWAIFILTVVIYQGWLPISFDSWGILIETKNMAIYLALGFLFGSESNLRAISGVPISWLVVGASGLIFCSLAGWSGLPDLYLLQPTLGVSGIVGVAALAILAERTKLGSAVQFLGRYSLEIYLLHTIASAGVRITLNQLGYVSAVAPHLVLGTLMGLSFPIVVAQAFKQFGLQFAFTLPRGPGLRLAGKSAIAGSNLQPGAAPASTGGPPARS